MANLSDVAVVDSEEDSTVDHTAELQQPSVLVAEQQRYKSLSKQLADAGFTFDEATETLVGVEDATNRDQTLVKDLRAQVDRLSRDLHMAEEERKDVLPSYERCRKNADLKERVDSLHREIHDEEVSLKSQDQRLRTLDAELSHVTALYKKKKEQHQQFNAQIRRQLDDLLVAVAKKVEQTTTVDDENTADYINPGDCIEIAGQLAASRERDHIVVDRQLRELRCSCDSKKEECDTLERENANTLQKAREARDEGIRLLVYNMQDQRNKLLADIEEWTTVTSDQALNLKVGHIHTNAKDRQRFTPLQSSTGRTPRGIVDSAPKAFMPLRRKTAFRDPVQQTSDEVRTLTELNKQLLQELAQIKTDVAKASTNRTDAIQSTKKLQHQLKRDQDHFDAALQKLETQIYAESAATKALEKENQKLADAVQQLEVVVQTNRKHLKHARVKTAPLPIE